MILLLKPAPPFMEYYIFRESGISNGTFRPDRNAGSFLARECAGDENISVGHFLYNGGGIICEDILSLDTEVVDKLQRTVNILPEHNELTLFGIRVLQDTGIRCRSYLLCDTAFFTCLPPEASIYAIPELLTEQGIRRFGGYGLEHRWALMKAEEAKQIKYGRVVSVYLGDNPNLAAVKEGRPVETTIGFSAVEGIPSSRACGDIDPTVVFQLISSGMSFSDINSTLSRDSGYTGFMGRDCRFDEIATAKENSRHAELREVLIYDIIKYMGAFTALMGGLDTVIFSGPRAGNYGYFISEICRRTFLKEELAGFSNKELSSGSISADGSGIDIYCFETDKWSIMSEKIEVTENKER